jgi:hypothetical protein
MQRLTVGRFEQNQPSGAKARLLIDIYGTTEVVPFQDGFELISDEELEFWSPFRP